MDKSLCKEDANMNWNFLSKYRTQLMGIAIIWVVLYHGNEYGMILPRPLNIVNFVLEKVDRGIQIPTRVNYPLMPHLSFRPTGGSG